MRHTRTRLALLPILALLLATLMAPAAVGQEHGDDRLTNLSHLDFLATQVDPPQQEGHDTYRLEEQPDIGVLWTYAEPGEDGFRAIGGGEYDPETDTYSQGAYNADDISRAAVVYLRHWRQFGDEQSREMAYQLLRGLTYLQTLDGEDAGNVVLWMQPDGTLNPSAEPVELPDPSDSDVSYWLARTIWALGEGYRAFVEDDPDFAAFLADRLDLAVDALDRQLLEPEYGQTQLVDGLRWPAWLIRDGADASSEAVYGLTAFVEAGGDGQAEQALRQLAEGIAMMQLGDVQDWPYFALMPWAQSRSVWHAWGDQMAGALALAGETLDEPAWTQTAVRAVGSFTPHVLVQGGPENGWQPAPTNPVQIAYGTDATLQNLLRAHEATGRESFHRLAGIAAAWYFGNNPAGEAMYDPATGRTFDGVNRDRSINRNSGAESTIHGLLSMLALDADPELAARARITTREQLISWQLVEAEQMQLQGDATVQEADPAWTGESLWSDASYVRMKVDARAEAEVLLPTRDRYLVQQVFWRQGDAGADVSAQLGDREAGTVWHGGAGNRGVTPEWGYLAIDGGLTDGMVPAGPRTLAVTNVGPEQAVELDAMLVQPALEWLVLGDEDSGTAQAVVKSFDDELRVARLALPTQSEVTAESYDRTGRLFEERTAEGGFVQLPVPPGGFAVITPSG